jgi:hypothetical protein
VPTSGLSRPRSIQHRLRQIEWTAVAQALNERGWATTPPLLTAAECAQLIGLYADERRFRSRVDMARFRFGEGEYKYFANPLPPVVLDLRRQIYPKLAPIAGAWETMLGGRQQYPADLNGFLLLCAEHGQTKPTPLLLRYTAGGYNCLHQDLYGNIAFPLQLTCLLSRPGRDFTGGEFLLVEQRPRAQSAGTVVPLKQGQAVIFATRHRPAKGARGAYRVTLRHGVSRVISGERYSLGVIFHDAK